MKPLYFTNIYRLTDNLLLHLAYMGLENMEVEPVLERVGLPGIGTQPVREFSLGMRQRLAIARAIVHKPEVLILDEPVNGLDPVGMREMRILFRQLVDQDGITILLSSHLLSEIQQVTDRIGVIADGRLVLEEDTRNNPQKSSRRYRRLSDRRDGRRAAHE